MIIKKSIGITDSENFLDKLCSDTFLNLWSYANPYKDDGDECCDLIAIFENRVFLFFDREIILQPIVDHDFTGWERWKRKVVDKQIKTVLGAEKYIRSGRKLYLDAKQKTELPIPYNSNDAIIHKIIIAKGASDACSKFSDENITGSLAITYSDIEKPPEFPFLVNLKKDDMVHVYDSHTLPSILSELDTIADLTSFFDAKEEAIKSLRTLTYCNEEDLLAYYYQHYNTDSNSHFILDKEKELQNLFIPEGLWVNLVQHPQHMEKKRLDKDSYLWDEIIKKTTDNALNSRLGGNSNIFSGQSAVYEMAKEPRFARREFSKRMTESILNFPENDKKIVRNLSYMSSFYKNVAYVFLQLKCLGMGSFNERRPKRQKMLEIACAAAIEKFPYLEKVIGIAIDSPKYTSENAEDFILLNSDVLTDIDKAEYRKLNQSFNFFTLPETKMECRQMKNFPDIKSK